MQKVVGYRQILTNAIGQGKLPVVRQWIEKLRDRVEDLFALVFWDGASWKEPPKDRRNGL
jgi:hypothetical protein